MQLLKDEGFTHSRTVKLSPSTPRSKQQSPPPPDLIIYIYSETILSVNLDCMLN